MAIDSKRKGSAWERKICTKLSLWISDGARANMFSRNVLSGGAFTLAATKGKELGLPGDIAASHPLAFEFLSKFAVEAKHHKRISLDTYLWDFTGHNFLARVWESTKGQANRVGVHPMIIAKQNQCPAIVLVPIDIGQLAISNSFPAGKLHYHALHGDRVMLLAFEEMLRFVRPARFLRSIDDAKIDVSKLPSASCS